MTDILSLVLIILSLSVHEFSHALAADHLGDPTPRSQGRLSLNPLVHLDPLGTLAMIFAGFGWAKPVQIDPYNLKNPRRDELIIAAAGPASNIAIAIVLSVLVYFFGGYQLFLKAIFLNLGLAVFNLIPVPPLDGSKILVNALPFESGYNLKKALEQYSTPLLVLLMLPLAAGQSLAGIIVRPIVNLLASLLLFF